MKLAIIGSRGFLAEYGGYETFVQKIAFGLSKKGFAITVYGIADYHNRNKDTLYPEIRRVWLWTIRIRFLEKVTSSFLGIVHACFSDADIIFSISTSPGLLLFLPRLFGKKIVVNPDGLEWRRPKWSWFIRFWLRISEWTAVMFSNLVVADSKTIANYIQGKYKKCTVFIPYGADENLPLPEDGKILAKYGLVPNNYFLQVCRLEPENNAHIVIEEFVRYGGEKDLAIVGDTQHCLNYKEQLKKIANRKVKFLGGIYNQDFKVILRNAYCYIHGHEAGGTNPVLLEAMASARCPIVLNVPYNLEVIAECGIGFSKNRGDLQSKLRLLEQDPNLVYEIGNKALERVKKHYTWDAVIENYIEIFKTVAFSSTS